MAHSHLTLQNSHLGHSVRVPVGFSWTALFFGFILLAYHKRYVISAVLGLVTVIVGPVPNLLLCWFYNRHRIHSLWKQGYRVIAIDSELSRQELSDELNLPLNSVQLNG